MAQEKKNEGILSTIDELRKTFGRSLPEVSEAGVVKRLVLSSPKINYLFGGGFPLNRFIEVYGSESAGKSIFASYIGSQVQKRTDSDQKTVLYVDMEYSFEKKYAENTGLDCSPDKFIFIQPMNGEEAFGLMEKFIKTKEIGLIVYDSTSATPTAAAMEDEYGKRSFGGAGLLFSEGLKKLNPYVARYNTPVILLTQMRAKIGFQSYGPPDVSSGGGFAPRFFASWRARLSKGEDIMNGNEVIGNKIKVKNTKSKIGYPKRSAELDLFYNSGFNSDAEYIDFMVQLGLVERKGGWYSNEEWGLKVQGVDKLLPYLYDNPDKFEEVKKTVNDMFGSYSVLDSQESDEGIIEEELIVD